MDLFKAITGKNPAEFEQAASILVGKPDVELFKKLVKQDDFLFDFVKNNVANRIKNTCNQQNYENLLQFLEYYSPSYDGLIAEILYSFSEGKYLDYMKDLFLNGTNSQKCYALKYLSLYNKEDIDDVIPDIRETSKSEDEYLANNSIEEETIGCYFSISELI